MDGTGYPRGLKREQMSVPARIMMIADIFEALTARDRPYKARKMLSECVDIMARMSSEGHIDPDLFALFLTSGVYRAYADKFISAEQIDEVDSTRYLSAASPASWRHNRIVGSRATGQRDSTRSARRHAVPTTSSHC